MYAQTSRLIRKCLRKIWKLIYDSQASPLVEEGLLIGLAIIVFILLLSMITNIMEWVNENLSKVI